MKIVLVHDQLNQYGGAEKTIKAISDMYPDAPIYTIMKDKDPFLDSMFKGRKIIQSWIGNTSLARKLFRWFLLLIPSAVESLPIPKDTDVIISSSSHFAKGIISDTNAVHICYCHTPTRYLWSDTQEYIETLPYNRFIKFLVTITLPFLRVWDYNAAQRVDHYIANSSFVAGRIHKFYKRNSIVIYPPVDVEKYISAIPHVNSKGNYFLIGGRMRPYKRFDLAIQAFNKLGIPLKIFGSGEDEDRLRAMAKNNIEFCGSINDEQKMKLFEGCKAFLYPQIEDFGITMIEAMAMGKPVIAFNAGGAAEIIKEGETGLLFEEQTWEDLASTVLRFDKYSFDAESIRSFAKRFSVSRFQQEIEDFVKTITKDEKSKKHIN